MGVSSIGIGSGLKVSDIISQMVALEKKPLESLQVKQDSIQTKLSTYAKIKSLTATLNDAASKLTRDSGWNGVNASSSNSAVSVTVTGIANKGSFDIDVKNLSQAQTSVSAQRAVDEAMGAAGKLKITQGGKDFEIDYTATDTLSKLAAKINEAVPGMTATLLRDASGKEQLMLRTKDTGSAAAFTTSWDPVAAPVEGAEAIPPTGFEPPAGMSFTQTKPAQNAVIEINGIRQESANDTFSDVLPGVKITVNQPTATDARISLTQDTEGMKKNIQAFMDAYNELNTLLAQSTAYDSESKAAGVLQADSSTVSLQNSLRNLMRGTASNASGTLKSLADIGLQTGSDGTLTFKDSAKLDKALADPDAIKSLFAAKAGPDGTGGGIATNFKKYTDDLLAYTGALNNKTDTLELAKKNNLADQTKVNNRAAVLEKRMTAQYTALDTKMASLSALSTYMEQQVAAWNKSTS
ncbi:flagellar filament capping protein FliD [Comamonas thiooxydans]|uniref:flagellar filament capping protein FliD n=1 Tax=Comamonas thiooxydans TaxID=363952 RepID=UPI00243245A2|nr:flagellar filament capping protein FliD [Comamonas thiooxydans]MDH1253837.1 flagellar filament capping protein FliD [Comamonas thiooxydans]